MQVDFIQNFEKSRSVKIGSSDIIKCIPHPEKNYESLGAWTDLKGERHHETALDLYEDKIYNIKQDYNFAADMGHWLEPKALSEFIKDNIDYQIAFDFIRGYQLHKLEQEFESNKAGQPIYINPTPFNQTNFKHNTEASTKWGIAHSDVIYIPPENLIDKKEKEIQFKKNGLFFNLLEPFILEAKSCNYFAFQARKKDQYIGYDLELKKWTGLPLKVYFQIQYQLFLYGIKKAYVSLIYNTNSKNFWEITANRKHQEELVTLATYMKNCIDTKTEPKKLVMNSKDIIKMYPEIVDDFREIQGDELIEILEVARIGREAGRQKKAWETKEKDATERMALHLRDTEQIKGLVNGSLQTIAKWKKTGGGRRVMGLKDIGDREDSKKLIRYMEKNGLINTGDKNRIPNIVIKLEELQ